MLLVPLEIANHHLRFGDLPSQHRRKRDAVIERIRLVAEERDLARGIVLAKLFRGGGSGKAVSDNDVAANAGADRAIHAIPTPPSFRSRSRARARRCRSARYDAALGRADPALQPESTRPDVAAA